MSISQNAGTIYFLLCCGWQIGLVALGWALHIRFIKRGWAGLLPDFRTFINRVKEQNGRRILPPR